MAIKQKEPEVKKSYIATQASSMMVVTDEVPEYIEPSANRGSEDVGQEDLVIPRLEVIQALSPAVKDGDPGYIPDARPGMLMNSVSKQLYGKEVMVVPVVFMKQWLVWRQRKDKDGKPIEGGFFGSFNHPEEAKRRADEEGGEANYIEIIETPQHFCLLLNFASNKVEEIMVSMPRTKAKISRQWNSMVRMAGGDRFSRVYRVTSSLEKKPQGDYYNFAVAQSGFPNKMVYDKAMELYKVVSAGRAVTMDVTDFGRDDEHGSASESEM